MPRLIVEAGKQIGSEFPVSDRMRLGRLDTCDAVIEDDNASREHAEIRLVKGRFYAIDLRSRNGTVVNGKRVQQAPLEPGDRIAIGDTTLLFYDDDHAARPTDTLGAEALRRATDEADAIEAAEAAAKGRAGKRAKAAVSSSSSSSSEEEDGEGQGSAGHGHGHRQGHEHADADDDGGEDRADTPSGADAVPEPPGRVSPARARGAGATADAEPDAQRDAAEAALFALLLVLTFLCASYATQILLRLFVA